MVNKLIQRVNKKSSDDEEWLYFARNKILTTGKLDFLKDRQVYCWGDLEYSSKNDPKGP